LTASTQQEAVTYEEALKAFQVVDRYLQQIKKPGNFPTDGPIKASSTALISPAQKKFVEDIAMVLGLYTPALLAELDTWSREQASYFIDQHKAEYQNKKPRRA
jgi:hypothetical protein